MNNIKRFRRKHKLSQRQLAELLQVNIRTVQRWETGEITPHPHTLLLIEMVREQLSKKDQHGK